MSENRFPPPLPPLVPGKRPPAFRPTGVKYPMLGGAIKALGTPDDSWEYSVNWCTDAVHVLAYDRPGGGKRYQVVTQHRGGWYIAYPPPPHRLYRLEDVRHAPFVVVCGGENIARFVRSVGLVATTSLGGPHRANQSDWSPLAEKRVMILPSFHAPGAAYARDVARLVHEAGAAEVKIVPMPDLEAEQDFVDWYLAHADGVSHEDMKQLLEDALQQSFAAERPVATHGLLHSEMTLGLRIDHAGCSGLNPTPSTVSRWNHTLMTDIFDHIYG